MPDQHTASRTCGGILYGVAAFTWWGLVGPVYFKAVKSVQSPEVLAHRIVWSVLLLWVLIVLMRQGKAAAAALRSRRAMLTLAASALLIAVNWYLFIWAVQHGHIAQASLGYFINPLVNVLLGVVFLRERLRMWQIASVLIAALGVGWMAAAKGQVPTLALGLAFSFGTYSLLRKMAPVEGLVGLTIETTLLAPVSAAYLAWLMLEERASFLAVSTRVDILLLCAGVVTSLPLIWFVGAARRLSMATLGFLQYISPSVQFLLAVLVYGEEFGSAEAISFGLIWTALAVFTIDAERRAPRSESRASSRLAMHRERVNVGGRIGDVMKGWVTSLKHLSAGALHRGALLLIALAVTIAACARQRHASAVGGGRPAAQPAVTVRPLEQEVWARPGGALVLPVEIEGTLRPRMTVRVPVTLDNGASLSATLWWIGTVPADSDTWTIVPRTPADPRSGAGSPAAEAGAWLGVGGASSRQWITQLASERVRTGGEGIYALVVQTPPADGDAPAPGQIHRMLVGDRMLTLRWLPVHVDSGPGEDLAGLVAPPAADSIRQSPWLRAALELSARSPLLRWRCRLAQGTGLSGAGRTASDRFSDPVLESWADQTEARWNFALMRLAGSDTDLARRVARRLGAVVEFGAGVAMPAWSARDEQPGRLLEALLRDELAAGERLRDARDWLAAEPAVVAWVIDDAGRSDVLSGGTLGTLGVANLTEDAAACWAVPAAGGSGAAAPEIVSVPARIARRIVGVAPDTPPEAGGAPVRARLAREGEVFTVHAGQAAAVRRVFSRRLPVIPPAASARAARRRPRRRELAGPRAGCHGRRRQRRRPTPRAHSRRRAARGVADRRACLPGVPGRTGPAAPDGQPRGSTGPGPESWMVYLELAQLQAEAAPRRFDFAGARAGRATELGFLRVWFGPFGAPTAVLRVNMDGSVVDQTGGVAAISPTSVQTAPVGRGWACWVPVPAGAIEPDGTLRLGVERLDARAVRSAWPRPMLPWQREPGRAAFDTSAWDQAPSIDSP